MTSENSKKIIFLTQAEALFLDDALTVLTDRESMHGIGGLRPVAPSALEVDDSELYLLREAAQTSVKFAEENVGYNLKRKIYLALLEDVYKDSLQFAKLMQDMQTTSTETRNKAKTNFS